MSYPPNITNTIRGWFKRAYLLAFVRYSVSKLLRRLAAIKIPVAGWVHRANRPGGYDYICKEGLSLNADRQVGTLFANVGFECRVHPQDGTDLKHQEFMENSVDAGGVDALKAIANPIGNGYVAQCVIDRGSTRNSTAGVLE